MGQGVQALTAHRMPPESAKRPRSRLLRSCERQLCRRLLPSKLQASLAQAQLRGEGIMPQTAGTTINIRPFKLHCAPHRFPRACTASTSRSAAMTRGTSSLFSALLITLRPPENRLGEAPREVLASLPPDVADLGQRSCGGRHPFFQASKPLVKAVVKRLASPAPLFAGTNIGERDHLRTAPGESFLIG